MSDTTTKAPDSGIVRLDDEEAVKRVLVDTLFGLWATINNLTRLRPSKPGRSMKRRTHSTSSRYIEPTKTSGTS